MALALDCAELIDITPVPHVLLSTASQAMPWWKAIGELIDNAFDASATRVSVRCSGRMVVVVDDGRGIPDVATACTLGGHRAHGKAALGRYGVGLKEAWRSAGDRIEITTVRGCQKSHLDFSIESIQIHDGKWKLPRPVTAETEEKPGTRIVLHLRDGKHKPGADCWEMIGWAFAPALLTGRQIVQGSDKTLKPIAPAKFPVLSETIADTLNVCGKQVHLNVGIMATGERIFRGPFWVQYGHRNIVGSSIGVGEYGDEHLAGTIVLGEGWKLTKNKDDFDDHKDELSVAIHDRIKPLLIKSATMSQDIESSALSSEIAGMLNAAIANARREKRNATRETSGTVLPVNTGRTRRKAAKVHEDKEGNVSATDGQSRRTGFTTGWFHDEKQGAGYYDYHANKVKFNTAHEAVAALKEAKNKLGLYSVAAAILADHHCTHDGASRLLIQTREFIPAFSFVLQHGGKPE